MMTKVGISARYRRNRPLASNRIRNPESAKALPNFGTMPPAI